MNQERLPEPLAVCALIEEVAREVIVPRFRRLASGEIRQKQGPWDLVTVADVEAERALAARLPALLPGSRVVGEEAVEADPGLLAQLGEDVPVWVIDPVDGTRNFAEGRERFVVIVALCRGGETLAGWIHHPLDGTCAHALAGGGAWMDGRPLRAAAPAPLREMAGSLSGGTANRLRARALARSGETPREIVRYFCTGLEYLDLARGTLHFSLYHRLKPWDHAAGLLLHREAGGYSALRETGAAYRPTGIVEDTILTAPDRETWEALHRLLGDI